MEARLRRPSTSRPNHSVHDGAWKKASAQGPRSEESTAAGCAPSASSALSSAALSLHPSATATPPPNTSPAQQKGDSREPCSRGEQQATTRRAVEAQRTAVSVLDRLSGRVAAQLQQAGQQLQAAPAAQVERRGGGGVGAAPREARLERGKRNSGVMLRR